MHNTFRCSGCRYRLIQCQLLLLDIVRARRPPKNFDSPTYVAPLGSLLLSVPYCTPLQRGPPVNDQRSLARYVASTLARQSGARGWDLPTLVGSLLLAVMTERVHVTLLVMLRPMIATSAACSASEMP